jgi:2-polyprenyl-6-methoxyphenol hydroxylase-like FAD-dependent oxidoreductase
LPPERKPAARVVIVGGGIGGLAAAVALRRGGHDAVVLERAAQLEAVGAGITLFANAMHALDRIGVGDAVRARGAAARRSAIRTSTGRELVSLPDDLLEGAVAIHRGELQHALLEAAAGSVRVGAEVKSVEQTKDGVIAELTDGSRESGDLLVGADGLNSAVRTTVAPAEPRYGGYTAWRGVSTLSIEPGALSESWGVGERFGLVDIGSRTYWFATANAPEGEPERPSERKAELLRRFSNWHPPIRDVLEATPDEAILRNDVYYMEPLAQWSRGRVVLLGDAAHATTPGIGQGAAQALEDAVVLAESIDHEDQIPAALSSYEAVRRPRAELALRLARQADRAAQLAHPLACRIRNAVVSRLPSRAQRRQLGPVVHHQV